MSYVVAGYVVTAVTLGAYAAWVLRRRRSLERALPPEAPR